MKFKYAAGLVSALAIMAASSAWAQTANSTSGAQSGSSATSGSSSGAAAISRGGAGGNASTSAQQGVSTNTGATVNQTYNTGGQSGVNYTGGTNSYNTERQTGDVTIRTTPTVYAPPVSGGNPCTLAVSGGVSVIGWGAAAGGTFVDEACATRQKIAMIHNAGYAGAAKELMCDDKATYVAFKTAGQACAFRQQFEAPGAPPAPMVQQQPGPVVVTPAVTRPAPVAAKTYPRCNPRLGINDNCVS